MSLASNLKYVMDVNYVNAHQLSQDSGISNSAIYRVLNYGTTMRSRSVAALAKALHCKPEDLTGDSLPTHLRKWGPDKEHCEQQLAAHLSPVIEPQDNMAVIQRMMSEPEPETVSLDDLLALFDTVVDDTKDPALVFALFGKEVYRLATAPRYSTTK